MKQLALIVSIPDLYTLTYFGDNFMGHMQIVIPIPDAPLCGVS